MGNSNAKVSAVNEDEPPGTPPPPYCGGNYSMSLGQSQLHEDDDNYSIINEEVCSLVFFNTAVKATSILKNLLVAVCLKLPR